MQINFTCCFSIIGEGYNCASGDTVTGWVLALLLTSSEIPDSQLLPLLQTFLWSSVTLFAETFLYRLCRLLLEK